MRLRYLSLLWAASLYFSLFCAPSFADRIQDCDKNLGKSVEQEINSTFVRVNWAYTLDKTTFDNIKKGVDTGGSVLVEGIPISGYGNYKEFHDAATREYQKYDYNYSEDRARAYIRTYFSQTSEAGYIACLATLKNSIGVTLWVANISDTVVQVGIQWVSKGKSRPETIDFRLNRKKVQSPAIQKIWDGSQSRIYDFERNPDKDLSFTVSLGADTDSLLIPVEPETMASKCGSSCDKCVKGQNGQHFCASCTFKIADSLASGVDHYDIPDQGGIHFLCRSMKPGEAYVVSAGGTIEALYTSVFDNRSYHVGEAINNGLRIQWWVDVGYMMDGDPVYKQGYLNGRSQDKSIKANWSDVAGTVPENGKVGGRIFVSHNQISPTIFGPVTFDKDFTITVKVQ